MENERGRLERMKKGSSFYRLASFNSKGAA
jgi:hypothetical protein